MTEDTNNKGLKDRMDIGRGPVNKFKVYLCKYKPKYCPYVLDKGAMGHDVNYAPEDYQLKVAIEKLKSPKHQQLTIKQSKLKPFRMKALDEKKSVNPRENGAALLVGRGGDGRLP